MTVSIAGSMIFPLLNHRVADRSVRRSFAPPDVDLDQVNAGRHAEAEAGTQRAAEC